MAKGKVVQFRRSKKHYKPRHFILDVNAENKDKAESFVGKKVEWESDSGKIIKGEIKSTHGNKGLVRAIFEKGLPGQAINSEIEVK